MKHWHKILINGMSALLTFFTMYVFNYFLVLNDWLSSIEPGRSSSARRTLNLTLIILIFTPITYFIFKFLLRFLTYIWLKIFPLQS